MNQQILNLIQSGALYVGGRDKEYRPLLVFDAQRIAHFNKTDPGVVSSEAIQNGFMFLWNYIKHVIFLPGHVNHWISITELGQLSMYSIPRE